MKKFALTVLFIFLCSAFLCAQSGEQSARKQTKNEKEVRATLDKWAAAVVSRDPNELAKIYADDLLVIDQNGGTRGKKEELQVLAPTAGMKTVSVVNEDIRLRDYGKAVVVTAITKMKFLIGEKESAMAMRYTAVFVKLENRWQITTLQTARIVTLPKTQTNK